MTTQTGGAKARSWVRLDRYAIFDLGREHRLDDRARLLLLVLCVTADFRTCAVCATIRDLAELTGTSRSTIPKVLRALDAAGVVKITHPFGPNRQGEVEILAWRDLVVEVREPRSRVRRVRGGQPIADDSRTNRASTADDSPNDQGEPPLYRGDEGERRSGSGGTSTENSFAFGEETERLGGSLRHDAVETDSGPLSRVDEDPEPAQEPPGTRCADCRGWLNPPLPDGESWCLCDEHAWWKQG